MKQSGLTQIRSNKAAVRFLFFSGLLDHLNSNMLSRRLAVCAAISAWETPEEMP